jgi:hypothetical protein
LRCGRMVRPSVRYSVPGFIDSNPELFRRPLRQPVNVRVPLLHDLREPGLLLPTLDRPVYIFFRHFNSPSNMEERRVSSDPYDLGKKLLIAQNGVLKRPETLNEGLRIPARTSKEVTHEDASRLASCHYTGA